MLLFVGWQFMYVIILSNMFAHIAFHFFYKKKERNIHFIVELNSIGIRWKSFYIIWQSNRCRYKERTNTRHWHNEWWWIYSQLMKTESSSTSRYVTISPDLKPDYCFLLLFLFFALRFNSISFSWCGTKSFHYANVAVSLYIHCPSFVIICWDVE